MEFIQVLLTSLIVTSAAVPLTIFIAKKLDLVDDPTKRPHPAHIQTRVVPRAGGLAIFIGIVVTSLLFLPLEKYLLGLLSGITTLLVVGLIDDKITRFSPYLRLILLLVAASLAVGSGIGISYITNPLPSILPGPVIRLDSLVIPFDFLGPHKIILLADLFAVIWIIALTQIINWSKGVDGQMPGITTTAALTLAILSLKFYFAGDPNQLQVAKLSLIVAGSSIGFLIFNWHPAKIFPGFSGSTILAFMLAVLSILSGAKVATALIVLAIPTADFIFTIVRRVLSGRSPVWGDRGHLHHLLLDRGWSHAQISLFYILVSAILGATAIFVEGGTKTFLLLSVAAGAFLLVLWINSFGVLSKRLGPGNG